MTNDAVRTGVIGESKLSVGRFTYGFENLHIRQWGEGATLEIGAFCSLADKITIFLGGNHRTDWITTFPFGHIYQSELGGTGIDGHPTTKGDVVIGNDVWIGSGVTIMSGVNIGDGAVIAANACVTNNVACYTMSGGNPAKPIKQRFDDEIVAFLLKLRWWDLPLEDIRMLTNILSAKPDKSILSRVIAKYRT